MISVVVPVYNVESYLRRCIESIIEQKYTDLEIILVDDGSTDKSGIICDEYADKDGRIKVIHKKNGGLSDARNAGIELASGVYIGFVDSDDWISPSMYMRLHGVLESTGADVVECRAIKTSSEDTVINDTESIPEVYNTEQALSELIKENNIHQITVNKLYKAEYVKRIMFEVGRVNEDEFWTYQIIGKSKKTAYINERLYYYFQRPGSIINSAYNIRRLDALDALEQRLRYIESNYPSLEPLARTAYLGACFYAYQRICGTKGIDKERKYRKGIKRRIYSERSKKCASKKTFKRRMWFRLFTYFPEATARVRNIFGIGL